MKNHSNEMQSRINSFLNRKINEHPEIDFEELELTDKTYPWEPIFDLFRSGTKQLQSNK